jgi:hypothetical protein
MHFASGVPTVPVQRHMRLAEVVAARDVATPRPGWAAVFLKAYARVTDAVPELRRVYVKLPWPHLYEYPNSVASVAVERAYEGENGVFFGRINDPASVPLTELQNRVRAFTETPIKDVKAYRKMLRLARLPRPARRLLMWLGLNLPRSRPAQFGTFGLTVYSALGAESLHPLSPLTTTLTYGVIDRDGGVNVRLIYDHRVLDGATVARALARLEGELTGSVCEELRSMAPGQPRAA